MRRRLAWVTTSLRWPVFATISTITTVVVFGILAWSLIYVFKYIDVAPQVDKQGNVVLDKFGNAKTILLAMLPLATTAVGYWLGSKGTVDAQAHAAKAEAQKTAILSVSTDPNILTNALAVHPEAFK